MSGEAEEENKLKIVDLNDDCLTEIAKYLNTQDLMALFEAHRRFHPAVGNVVPHRCIVVDELKDLGKVHKFLEKCGDKIRTMRIVNIEASDMKVLLKYLTGGQIESCEFGYEATTVMSEDFIEENSTFFKSLKTLKLTKINLTGSACEKLFDVITEVRRIDLYWVYFPNETSIFDVLTKIYSLRHLKTLWLVFCNLITAGDRNLLPINTNIEELGLEQISLDFAFLSHFPNLRNLHVKYLNESFDYESLKFDNLKKLSLCYFDEVSLVESLLSVSAQSNDLESLKIIAHKKGMFSDIVQCVLKLTNLKELDIKVTDTLDVNVDIIEFAKNLQQLRKFSLHWPDDDLDEAKVCEFIQLVPGLELFRAKVPNSALYSLFDKITEIRRSQKGKVGLVIECVEDQYNGPLVIQKNQYVQVRKCNDDETTFF